MKICSLACYLKHFFSFDPDAILEETFNQESRQKRSKKYIASAVCPLALLAVFLPLTLKALTE